MENNQTQPTLAREYETIYVLRPDVPNEDAKKVSARVEELMTKGGGRLTLVETWGRRPLAYSVRKYRRGVYVYLRYLGGGELVSELERNFGMLDSVLKFQTVRLRDQVDVAEAEVADDAVKFEEILPPGEDEVDETLERQLGLEPPSAEPRHSEPAEEAPKDGEKAAPEGEAPEKPSAEEAKEAPAPAEQTKDSESKEEAE